MPNIQFAASHLDSAVPFQRMPNEPSEPIRWISSNIDESICIASTLRSQNTAVQLRNVVEAFNEPSKEAYGTTTATIVESWLRGERVSPDNFMFFHRNQIPCMSQSHDNPIARNFSLDPAVIIESVGAFSKRDPHIKVCGSHIIQIPTGKYGKVTRGTSLDPVLLDEGPHVIHDSTLQFNASTDIVSKLSDHINHGIIHVLRVQPGKLAKVWYGSEARILEHRAEPYVIKSPMVKIGEIINQNELFISHGNYHRIRVPKGKIAKVWLNNVPRLLTADSDVYEFNTPYFSTSGPDLTWLVDANSKLIVHGSIKRILPITGECCVCSEFGRLLVLFPSPDNKPFQTENENFAVDDFLSTNVQTLVFPSEQTKADRRQENKTVSDDEVNYEVFTTRDSLKIGIKILLVFRIKDPQKTLSMIRRTDIVRHVENLSCVDLGKAIQQSTSQEFLCFTQTKANPTQGLDHDLLNGMASDAAPLQHFTDVVKHQLAHDLLEYGIELVRLNVETPKILDKEIAKSMEQQSLLTSRINAEEAILDQQSRISRNRAEQAARVATIEQEQKNRATVTNAEAELTSAKLRAEAMYVAAEGAQRAASLQGQQYKDHPELLRIELAKIQSQGLLNAKLSVVVSSESMKDGLGSMVMPGLLWQQNMQQQITSKDEVLHHHINANGH